MVVNGKKPACIIEGCKGVAECRGLCRSCWRSAWRKVRAGKTTWDAEERAGRARPVAVGTPHHRAFLRAAKQKSTRPRTGRANSTEAASG
jgi:hypothetical protein